MRPALLPWYRHGAALACGALMQFAFSPFDLAWLAIAALAGWFYLLQQSESPFLNGWAFGFGWFGLGAWWLADTFHIHGHLPYIVGLLCVALVGAVMGLLPALWAWVSCKVAGKGGRFLLALPAAAILVEWLRGHIFTGLPWTALGNLILDTPAVGWAMIAGVYGTAFIPVLAAAALAALADARYRRNGAIGMAMVALLILLAPTTHTPDTPARKAALIQANIPQDVKWDAAFLIETMRRFEQLTDRVAGDVNTIIWPEAAVPFFIEDAPGWDGWLNDRMQAWGKTVLFGGLKQIDRNGDMPVAQSGLYLFDPATETRNFVGKQHLVPFGEYVPTWLPFIKKLVPAIADFRPADDAGVLATANGAFGSIICYESIFPEEIRKRVHNGADVLVVVTNDAWYGTSPAAWQHLQAARMRAVESGRYVLRAANTGISAIIAPDGRITATAPWWTQAAVTGSYQQATIITPYMQWGDWPALALAAMMLLAICYRRRE